MEKTDCTKDIVQTYKCSYSIQTPFVTPTLTDKKEQRYVDVDKCILPELLKLWEAGIVTTGCCCGHGDAKYAYIGVLPECVAKMKDMGYDVQFNRCRPMDEDTFNPKTAFDYSRYMGK